MGVSRATMLSSTLTQKPPSLTSALAWTLPIQQHWLEGTLWACMAHELYHRSQDRKSLLHDSGPWGQAHFKKETVKHNEYQHSFVGVETGSGGVRCFNRKWVRKHDLTRHRLCCNFRSCWLETYEIWKVFTFETSTLWYGYDIFKKRSNSVQKLTLKVRSDWDRQWWP